MSIQSEINRISGNISDSLDAVAAKGVTVPAGSTSDDLAGLIELITGGSGENGDVYQDQDGYLVLSDEPGTNVTVTSLSVTSNGTYTAPTGTAYSPVSVSVQPVLQSKTVTPSETEQTVTPDSGKDGLSSVIVDAISSSYVGSGVTRRSSTDLSASGATVTAPAGYYASSASKSVSSMTLPTSTSASATSGYTSKATVSRSTSDQYINIGTGYNSAGGYYKINAVPDGSVSAKASITESGASIFTYDGGIMLRKENVNNAPTLTAGYVSSISSSTSTVGLMASCNIQGAQTITPSTTNQTIASGTYLTGTQTIAGDADLVSGNIRSGVEIFGVSGSSSVVNTSDANATASDILSGKTAYVGGSKISGNLEYENLPSPSITISNDGSSISATVSMSDGGVVQSGSSETTTISMPQASYSGYAYKNQSNKLSVAIDIDDDGWIDSSDSRDPWLNIDPATYDSNLTAANIAEGVTIYGITGTHSGGGTVITEKTVKFRDYDGTVLYSYTPSEFDALTTLPAAPSHTGLTSQGWTETLASAKARVSSNGYLDVGALFITDDEKTRIYVTIDEFTNKPYMALGVNGSVTVSWGDGTTSLVSGSSLTTMVWTSHDYGTYVGNKTVTIEPSDSTSAYSLIGNSYGSGLWAVTNSITSANERAHYIYKNRVYGVELGANVVLGTQAFAQCQGLEYITVPSILASIGSGAFAQCRCLKYVSIPQNVTITGGSLFQNCYTIPAAALPESVTTVGASMFYGCYSAESITLSSATTTINGSAFYECHSLKYFKMPSGITSISTSSLFRGCHLLTHIDFPSVTTTISSNMCYDCFKLESVSIPSTITGSIGSSAFYNCYSLKEFTIPSGITSIGDSAFYKCYALTDITIPSGVTSIGQSAFYYCENFEHITIPSGVTSLGNQAFAYCTSLDTISIPNTITSMGTYAFHYCYSLHKVTIPAGVPLNNYMFDYCYGLKELTILSSPTSIPSYFLSYNYPLQSFTIPNTVTSLSTYSVGACNTLTSLTVPSSVTSIASKAFANNYNIMAYHFLSTTPPTLAATDAFLNINANCVIYVPVGSLSDYQTASNWSTYASQMQEEPT